MVFPGFGRSLMLGRHALSGIRAHSTKSGTSSNTSGGRLHVSGQTLGLHSWKACCAVRLMLKCPLSAAGAPSWAHIWKHVSDW